MRRQINKVRSCSNEKVDIYASDISTLGSANNVKMRLDKYNITLNNQINEIDLHG